MDLYGTYLLDGYKRLVQSTIDLPFFYVTIMSLGNVYPWVFKGVGFFVIEIRLNLFFEKKFFLRSAFINFVGQKVHYRIVEYSIILGLVGSSFS